VAAGSVAALIALIASSGWAPAARAATVTLPANAVISGGMGTTSNIDLSATGMSDAEAADIDIQFDSTVATVSGDAIPGGVATGCLLSTNATVQNTVRIAIACAQSMTDSGVLVSIPFQSVATGSTALTFTRCSLNEDAVSCVSTDGQLTTIVLTPTETGTATLSPTETATATPSATFTPSVTGTSTSTLTATPIPTATVTSTATFTRTATLTPVATRTATTTATATAAPALAATFIGQSVPAAMTAGQPYSVSVTMQNTGAATWTAAGAYRLGAVNPYDNTTWGMNRVGLASGESIAPGQQKTFTWTVTAPATAGPYNFQWRMLQEGVTWFGDTSTNVAVTVSAASGPNATYVSQSVPSSMTAGQSYSVSVTMKNSGGTTWTAASAYRLGAINPYDNTTWGMNRVGLASGDSIAPGQQKTFTWTVTAPATAGPYNFQWRMLQEGVTWFGDTSTNVAVTVAAASGPNATFVSQSVPTTMSVGQPVSVSVTMKNSGGTTWTAASFYRLGAVNPYDNTTWGMNRVGLASGDSVAPGQQKTFSWTVTAPATAGTYNFQWRMLQEGITWFGDLSTNAAISVRP
jgi:hypothetical protein